MADEVWRASIKRYSAVLAEVQGSLMAIDQNGPIDAAPADWTAQIAVQVGLVGLAAIARNAVELREAAVATATWAIALAEWTERATNGFQVVSGSDTPDGGRGEGDEAEPGDPGPGPSRGVG